jgi:hypothetical protein
MILPGAKSVFFMVHNTIYDKRRFRMRRILTILALAVVMIALPMSAYASQPVPVSGYNEAIIIPVDIKPLGNSGNAIFTMMQSDVWTGGISGASDYYEFTWVAHNLIPIEEFPYMVPGPDSWYNIRGVFTLENVSVLGTSYNGSLTIGLNIKGAPGNATGHWRILSGTDQLQNLRGSGTMSLNESPPNPYTGQVHFDP